MLYFTVPLNFRLFSIENWSGCKWICLSEIKKSSLEIIFINRGIEVSINFCYLWYFFLWWFIFYNIYYFIWNYCGFTRSHWMFDPYEFLRTEWITIVCNLYTHRRTRKHQHARTHAWITIKYPWNRVGTMDTFKC